MSDERDLKSHQIMELTRALERVTALADALAAERHLVLEIPRLVAAERIRGAIAGPQ